MYEFNVVIEVPNRELAEKIVRNLQKNCKVLKADLIDDMLPSVGSGASTSSDSTTPPITPSTSTSTTQTRQTSANTSTPPTQPQQSGSKFGRFSVDPNSVDMNEPLMFGKAVFGERHAKDLTTAQILSFPQGREFLEFMVGQLNESLQIPDTPVDKVQAFERTLIKCLKALGMNVA